MIKEGHLVAVFLRIISADNSFDRTAVIKGNLNRNVVGQIARSQQADHGSIILNRFDQADRPIA